MGSPKNGSTVTLSSSHGVVKACVAIFQVLYGSWELYVARGSQFERYGYTAFSLTLVPYIAMSLLNLVAAIVEPQYPCVFLVKHGKDVPLGVRDEINNLMGGAVAVGIAPKDRAPEENDSPDSAGHAPSRVRKILDGLSYFTKSQLSFGRVSNISVP